MRLLSCHINPPQTLEFLVLLWCTVLHLVTGTVPPVDLHVHHSPLPVVRCSPYCVRHFCNHTEWQVCRGWNVSLCPLSFLLARHHLFSRPFTFVGTNAYYLHTLNDIDIDYTFGNLSANGIKVVRTWAFNGRSRFDICLVL